MRRQPTDAENVLWQRLKAKRLEGWKFRRQEPVAGHVADFLCYEARLVIEVDGGQHADDADRDEQRTRAIAAEGFRVVRFWNNEVLENIDGVLEAIVGHLEK
jgi:very-short-patch-repair endonuclease